MGADAVASRVTEAMKDAHEKSSTVGSTVPACEHCCAARILHLALVYPVSHQR